MFRSPTKVHSYDLYGDNSTIPPANQYYWMPSVMLLFYNAAELSIFLCFYGGGRHIFISSLQTGVRVPPLCFRFVGRIWNKRRFIITATNVYMKFQSNWYLSTCACWYVVMLIPIADLEASSLFSPMNLSGLPLSFSFYIVISRIGFL